MTIISIILLYIILAFCFAYTQVFLLLVKLYDKEVKQDLIKPGDFVYRFWVSLILFPILLIGIAYKFITKKRKNGN
jgi:hypothetical protein